MAFSVCNRFSASSKMMLCGELRTSSVTSLLRDTGRQCMTWQSFGAIDSVFFETHQSFASFFFFSMNSGSPLKWVSSPFANTSGDTQE